MSSDAKDTLQSPAQTTAETKQEGSLNALLPSSFPAVSESIEKTTNAAVNTAQQVLQSATQTANQILPSSVTAYLPGSQQPAPNDTPDVPEKSSTFSQDVPPHISTPEPGSGTKTWLSTDPNHLPAPGTKAQKYSLPSTETPTGSSTGVGSLSGSKSEASVANLPDERSQLQEPTVEPSGPSASVAPPPSGPPSNTEERVRSLDEVQTSRGSNVTPVAATTAAGAFVTRTTASTTDATRHAKLRNIPGTLQILSDDNLPEIKMLPPTELKQFPCHKRPETVPGTREEVPKPKTAEQPTLPPDEGTSPLALNNHQESPVARVARHKVKFIDKVKGEILVFAGKLGRNEKKVEEGKHLMGKR